ncbi:putative hydrolase [Mycena epipterygia]|nr:putative hydrolase [Mycena epipterygia]
MLSIFMILISVLLAHPGYSCPHVEDSALRYEQGLEIARVNNARRATQTIYTPVKTVITNVRVFDGERLMPLGTVYLDGGIIVPYAPGAQVVDGKGGVLLSGLIDAHNHASSVDDLEALASYGVTTTIVTSCDPVACESLKNHAGLTDVRFSGTGATTPNSTHAMLLGLTPNETITTPSQAPQFVADQIAAGATFIKLIAEHPDSTMLDQATMNALVASAHAKNLRAICHAADYAAVDRALAARVDQFHHVPEDVPLDSGLISRFLAQNAVAVPTLTITRAFVLNNGGHEPVGNFTVNYAAASTSVTRLYQASVPILAGTDSNGSPVLAVAFGSSLHSELELLVGAGMSTVDVLRSATVLPAQHNLLFDRGVIAPGMRADLLLISGDPIANISNTRNIQRVWIAGVEYSDVATS